MIRLIFLTVIFWQFFLDPCTRNQWTWVGHYNVSTQIICFGIIVNFRLIRDRNTSLFQMIYKIHNKIILLCSKDNSNLTAIWSRESTPQRQFLSTSAVLTLVLKWYRKQVYLLLSSQAQNLSAVALITGIDPSPLGKHLHPFLHVVLKQRRIEFQNNKTCMEIVLIVIVRSICKYLLQYWY